ncbi:extracellular solute-binding protein [Clostridium botulinum]|nr:extracellular solute-binding protein [Clostridium botulinum]NFI17545.1 extracellular solute-binding protein [Clostridium botulinum]NFI54546.1 extracellular solute-binding protein [Clostridium botulinum]NFL94696.1 extracellular solute-binding protein [Clostridium botulinum]NFN19858.1 extracellular solute-binding protein [Clostridium botulinum]
MKNNLLIQLFIVSIVMIVGLGGCNTFKTTNKNNDLIIYTSHPKEFSDPIISEFEKKTNINVNIVKASTGELLKNIEEEKTVPLGDVIWGGSVAALKSRTDFLEEYISKNEENIYEDYRNSDGKITRFTIMPSVLIVNLDLAKNTKIDGFEDLLNSELKGKIAVVDPGKSSTAFESLTNQLYAMGNNNPDEGWPYMENFLENTEKKMLNSSSAVFNKVIDGEYTVGLTYEGALKYISKDDPVKIVYPKEGIIANPDCVAIIKGAEQIENAKKFIDFLTSKEVQTMVSEELCRRSVRSDVQSEKFEDFNKLNIVRQDETWVLNNKQEIIKRYKNIIENQ